MKYNMQHMKTIALDVMLIEFTTGTLWHGAMSALMANDPEKVSNMQKMHTTITMAAKLFC